MNLDMKQGLMEKLRGATGEVDNSDESSMEACQSFDF